MKEIVDERTFDEFMKKVFPQKDKIVNDQFRKKKEILISQLQEYNRKKERFLQEDPDISDIKRRIDDNDIQILKLIESNKILLAAGISYINEKIEQFDKDNPTTIPNEIKEIEDKLKEDSYSTWMPFPETLRQPGTTFTSTSTGIFNTTVNAGKGMDSKVLPFPKSINEIIKEKTGV